MASVRREPLEAELSVRERAIVHYVEKMTRRPAAMCAADMEPLRAAGLEDRGILQVCAIAGFFNYVNRMADALGVGRGEEEAAK